VKAGSDILADPIVVLAADRIAKGSKSFAGAARLFEPETRASAFMLYAWCRHCDDEIDGQVLGFGRQIERRPPEVVLEELRAKTIAAIDGQATEPIYQALQRVVAAHHIPRAHPLELITGMEMDVEMEAGLRRYRTVDDLLAYCYHVAGVVGVMMAMVMGVRERQVLWRASDLGIAFQLTNIVRDIVGDAEVGRVYLPDDLLGDAGLSEKTLALTENRPVLFGVAADLLALADTYYRSAEAGLPHLPYRSAWAVASARRVYRDIGALVRQRRHNAWDARVSTSKARKLTGVGLAAGDAALSRIKRGPRDDGRTGLWTPPSLSP
jgi:15-cis-phytoene synthase